MAPRQLPGVYMVLCLVNNKRYYGESKNISQRISQHKSRLRRNIHEILELQRDFNLYGEESFEFSAIYLSKDFTLEQRVALEIELIGRFNNLCYNKFDKNSHKKENNPFWGHEHSDESRQQRAKTLKERRTEKPLEGLPILLNNAIYPSLSEASRQTNHSRDTIRRWLNDPSNTNCVAVDASKPREGLLTQDPFLANTALAKSVSIYGDIYPSIAQAARERNCSRANIQRLLKTDSKNCFFIP
uniref:Putative GIY-YIG homing endonuclease n=1 Tax=Lobochlamys segnis TaxID=52035 RepID=A0A0S2IBU7_9CHLO|nr:putative GIY-YIG homing endonuclease [Lobochlamys segnis]